MKLTCYIIPPGYRTRVSQQTQRSSPTSTSQPVAKQLGVSISEKKSTCCIKSPGFKECTKSKVFCMNVLSAKVCASSMGIVTATQDRP